MRRLLLSGFSAWLFIAFAQAASAEAPPLSLDDLFTTPKLTGTPPSRPAWSPDSKHLAFTWNDAGMPRRGLWVVTAEGENLRRIDSQSRGASVGAFAWAYDDMILSVRGGALWKTDIDSGDEALLARIGRGAWNLSVSPGGDKAAYLQNGDLWLVDLANGEVTQATNVGIPSLSSLPAGRYSRPEREIGPGIWSGPTYKWSVDGETIALHIVDRREMRQVPFPDYLAEETNPNLVRRGYPGDSNEIRSVGLLNADDLSLKMLPLRNPESNQVIDFNWSTRGDLLLDIAADTAVERKLYVVRQGSTRLREIWRSERESRMYTSFASAWHTSGEHVVFLSDRDDRYGLYVIDNSPSKDLPRPITDPGYDVLSAPITIHEDDVVFYAGNGEGPYERHVYWTLQNPMGDPEPVRITNRPGQNTGYPSWDGQHVAVIHSSDTSPPDLYVVSVIDGVEKRVTNSPLPAFREQQLAKVRYVSFPSQIDDYTLHARIMEPADLDPDAKYPVLFGPVYSGTARNRWAGNYSLVQQLLVQKGYIVVQVDVRGSTGYGRDFREEFLMDFAGDDIEDLASAVEYLKTVPYMDTDRMGIWGSSYGGTLSVYSLLKKPGLFKVGVAAASAVDPLFFGTDDVAIVRRPDTHPEIFERKAKFYAENLEDHLLLIHGMQDHVVPFKTTAVLAEELIKAGKDFDFAFAPGATHAWSRERHYERYLFGKLVQYFDRYLMKDDD